MGERTSEIGVFARWAGLTYATVGFVLTHVIFAILILFLIDWLAYPSIDGAQATGTAASVAIDLGLIVLFGLQHSGMARTAIKRLSHAVLPEDLERATYVHFSNAALALLVFAWQPIPVTVWAVEGTSLQAVIWLVFVVGWTLALTGSLLIDHLQLLGMRQAWSWFKGKRYEIRPFQRHWLYEHLRHPIQLGLILAFWAAPHMTVGHALFAAGLTVYMLVGTHLEEKDLIATFGEDYTDYRARVPAMIPRLRRRERKEPGSASS